MPLPLDPPPQGLCPCMHPTGAPGHRLAPLTPLAFARMNLQILGHPFTRPRSAPVQMTLWRTSGNSAHHHELLMAWCVSSTYLQTFVSVSMRAPYTIKGKSQQFWYLNKSFSLPNLALWGAYFAKFSKKTSLVPQKFCTFKRTGRSAFDSNLLCMYFQKYISIHVSREEGGGGAVGTSYIFQSANLWLGFLGPPCSKILATPLDVIM